MNALPPPPLRQSFLDGMSRAVATVNVVATDGPAGRAGVTVSAMSSVSADGEAPTLLVCVHHLSPAARTIIDNGVFCVNILRDDQSYISDTFAGRLGTADGDKFSCAPWTAMESGAPRVRDPLAAFDCRVRSAERIGTHHVFIGEVGAVFVAGAGNPLIFANRAYGAPARVLPARVGGETRARDRIRVAALHTFGPHLLPSVIADLEAAQGPVSLDLHEGDQRHLLGLLRTGAVDLAFLHDFDLGEDVVAQTVADIAPHALLPGNHPLASRDSVPLAELLTERLVLLDASPSRDYFLSLFAGVGAPTIGFRAQTFEMVRGLVAQGLGYSLLATRPASAMSYDGHALVTRPLADDVPPSRLVLARRRDGAMNAATRAFLWHCAAVFGLDLD
ncbi:MAG: LysR substrate-binding domain-containing protein [Amaricoccus sp.]|uniref:LysR substrate-binding domain-containing protein n=1 Tax=Amaricoccus sp. TaxID=1872485 RepID=UPI003315B8D8